MLRVGLTGGVGSGKSTVAYMLQALGTHVSNSDEIGRALMQPGQAIFSAVVKNFGPSILTPSGQLDRNALARAAFEGGRLEELNAIVHPAVIAAQTAWMSDVGQAEPAGIAVVDSALIFETRHNEGGGSAPWRTRFDQIVVVTAPEPLRRKRYLARVAGQAEGSAMQAASDDFARRIAAQWTDKRKTEMADFVLQNDGALKKLRADVERLYAKLRQDSADRVDEAM